MITPSDGESRQTQMRWVRALAPIGFGALVVWLTWPEPGAMGHESQMGLAFAVLSFLVGPAALAVAYMPAVLPGIVAALAVYLVIRLRGK